MGSARIERRGDTELDDERTDVQITYFKTAAFAVGFRTAAEKLRLVAMEIQQDEPGGPMTFSRLYERETDGTTDLFTLASVPTRQPTLVTPLRLFQTDIDRWTRLLLR
jgi:hypothetical protein